MRAATHLLQRVYRQRPARLFLTTQSPSGDHRPTWPAVPDNDCRRNASGYAAAPESTRTGPPGSGPVPDWQPVRRLAAIAPTRAQTPDCAKRCARLAVAMQQPAHRHRPVHPTVLAPTTPAVAQVARAAGLRPGFCYRHEPHNARQNLPGRGGFRRRAPELVVAGLR